MPHISVSASTSYAVAVSLTHARVLQVHPLRTTCSDGHVCLAVEKFTWVPPVHFSIGTRRGGVDGKAQHSEQEQKSGDEAGVHLRVDFCEAEMNDDLVSTVLFIYCFVSLHATSSPPLSC